MMTNPILEELHAARAKLLADVGGDLHRYVEEAKARALASGRPIAEPSQRERPRTTTEKSSRQQTDGSSSPLAGR